MSILEDKYHTVWVGTKNGLLNIVPNRDTDNNYTFDWNSYDENEGVQGRVFNVNSACGWKRVSWRLVGQTVLPSLILPGYVIIAMLHRR